MHKVVSDYTNVESSAIKVYVRARGGILPTANVNTAQSVQPPHNSANSNSHDNSDVSSSFITLNPTDNRFISIKDPIESRQKYGEVNFHFDGIFWTDIEQQAIFDVACKESVEHVMNGINVLFCLRSDGQWQNVHYVWRIEQ
jgi:hypothetical protein